jgi:hypothetical protein
VKYASIKALVLVLATGGLIAACASGTDSPDFSSGSGGGATVTSTGVTSGGGNGGNGGNGGSGGGGTGGSPSVDAGPTCIPQCNADSDCQNSCPVAQTGINCCDTATGLCYVASTPICPAPPNDGGVVIPPY